MDERQIQEMVARIAAVCRQQMEAELPLVFPVEASARHVHLTREAVERLFGSGAELTPERPLSQPGQFLCKERVSLVTSRGRIENVAVLGPERSAVQTELSATDCRTLGIHAPLRLSGDLRDAGSVYILGPVGMLDARGSVIVAQAHIHLPTAEAARAGVKDGQRVAVTLPGQRAVTLENVVCRVSDAAGLAMHIDFDEANACMLPRDASARMRTGGAAAPAAPSKETAPSAAPLKEEAAPPAFEGKLITEAVARRLAAECGSALTVQPDVILTPSAKDIFLHAGVTVRRMGGVSE